MPISGHFICGRYQKTFMKYYHKPFLQFAAGILVGTLLLAQFAFKKDYHSPVNQVHIPEVPESISFAGEEVPLKRWEIKERFDRELLIIYYQTSTIIYLNKLANRYFPIIEERLKANGVPEDFKYLCVAESNLQNAISRVGATGFWQFMSYTGPGYNLEIGKDVDERYHVMKSTDAACKYLKQAYAKFGSWTAAAASYNCGMGGYQRQAGIQFTKNYYDLLLPEETNRYMFRILSFKHLLENSEKLGFNVPDEDLYQPHSTRSVEVNQTIPDLAQYAIDQGTTYKMLRILNPWLRSTTLIVKPGKTYIIHLPSEEQVE